MNKEKIVKYLGYGVILVGGVLKVVEKRMEDQKTKQLIEDKVQKQVEEIVLKETNKRLDEILK